MLKAVLGESARILRDSKKLYQIKLSERPLSRAMKITTGSFINTHLRKQNCMLFILAGYAKRRSAHALISIGMVFYSVASHAGNCGLSKPEDFRQFFSRFSTDKAFSSSRTLYPLRVQRLEYGIDPDSNDEPKPVRSRVTKEQDAPYPTLDAYMKEHGLISEIIELRPKYAVVQVFMQDSDWLMTYHFRRKGNCWYMTELQDDSL